MFRRFTWFSAALALLVAALMQPAFAASKHTGPKHAAKLAAAKPSPAAVPAASEDGSEAGLDLTLRTNAAAMPLVTADGSPLQTPASHVYLLDVDTGTVLAEKAADSKMYPSSMTKMMTLYMIFDRLKQGTLTLNSQFTVSEKAWRMQGSKMFVPLGDQISLENLIRGIAIQSGNDACVVVAEGIAGSEDAFAGQMNDTAKKLGMTGTNFTDASGWPNPNHYTTPHDLAMLARAIIKTFPEYYHFLSEREFTYHGIRQFNRNLLLGNTALHVDGLKTGHTEAAGYGITLSAKDPITNRRLLLVVNGLSSEAERASEGERLLSWGFHNFDDIHLIKAGQNVITAKVWGGKVQEVALVAASDITVSLPKIGRDKVKITASYESPLVAPITKGQTYGKLTVTLPSGSKTEIPLVAADSVEKLSAFGRLARKLGM
jgi:D-alanyl-D-alanine carboxypeptidase (penicillin-binding protein 5/6)